MSYSEYTTVDPTEYALQNSMHNSSFQSQKKSNKKLQNTIQSPQQNQQQLQSKTQTPNIKNFYKQGFLSALKNFFNVQVGTVLVFTICFCLGGAFKDLVQSIISNIVQPLIVKLLLLTNIYNFSVISDIISEKDSILNITSTISQLVSFVILLITVYLLYVLINTVQ